MNNERRAQIAQAILDMTAGVEFETATAAQCDALATAIGGCFQHFGKSREEAEKLIRALADDMIERHIRRHFGKYEAVDAGPERRA